MKKELFLLKLLSLFFLHIVFIITILFCILLFVIIFIFLFVLVIVLFKLFLILSSSTLFLSIEGDFIVGGFIEFFNFFTKHFTISL